MTKLEEKLIDLGYKRNFPIEWVFIKTMNDINISICLCKSLKKIKTYWVSKVPIIIEIQQDIDNIQQAFNEMQKDLEELKEYE